MQTCSICGEKEIYRANPVKGKVVCSSCTLTKSKDLPAGKGLFEIGQDIRKNLFQKVEKSLMGINEMGDITVKSNFARNRTILVDGRYPLTFDAFGIAHLPYHLKQAFEKEMNSKPGRFAIENIVEPVKVVKEEATELVFEIEDSKDEVPQNIDLSYLTDDKKPSKRKKK